MYRLKVSSYFSSAHNLKNYRGKCESLHGHNWKVEVEIKSKVLDKSGMVLDFKHIKEKLEEILKELDHRYLNEIDYFKKINPTSEMIAKYIYTRLKSRIPNLYSVTIWESENSCATYEE